MIFGLTGGIATGKSSVARFFRANHVPVIDADLVAHGLVLRGTHGLRKVVAEFGPDILTPEGELDRPKLGAIVFQDAEKRTRLDAIMQPLIYDRTQEIFGTLNRCAGYSLVGLDAALLFEWGVAEEYRPIVVVTCSEKTQLQRLMQRNILTAEEALDRTHSQMPLADKVRQADFVLENDGTEDELQVKAQKVLKVLQEMAELQTSS
jgi:dephospho-CoA kinase